MVKGCPETAVARDGPTEVTRTCPVKWPARELGCSPPELSSNQCGHLLRLLSSLPSVRRYSWRLKESEIRFRGSGEYQRLVLQRIPASVEQIASFRAALDLIQVWDWRNDYDPNDIGCVVEDGSAWTFVASFEGRDCRCGGVNAYPSFADVNLTTTDRGRGLCSSFWPPLSGLSGAWSRLFGSFGSWSW